MASRRPWPQRALSGEPLAADFHQRCRDARTVWLAATAAAAAVTVALYARDLSKPQADFTLAVVALSAALLALCMTFNAWARRKNLKKIDQAGKTATRGGQPV